MNWKNLGQWIEKCVTRHENDKKWNANEDSSTWDEKMDKMRRKEENPVSNFSLFFIEINCVQSEEKNGRETASASKAFTRE